MHIEYNLLFVLGNAVEMKYNCTISHTLFSTLCVGLVSWYLILLTYEA